MPTTSKNSNPEISCIYVNYRSAQFLERSLQSLFSFETTVPFEVIIVNNDQQEQGEVNVLKEKFPIILKESFQNPGFGASANAGAELASGEILFFVNPDTQWRESFFLEVKEKFSTVSNLGGLGIQLVSSTGMPETETIGKTFTFKSLWRPAGTNETHTWLSGGALFVRKNIFQELAGFDEQFFMYFEDMDFCVRLHQKEYGVVLHTEASLIHFGGASHVTKASQKRIYDRSLYQYTKKHWNFFHYLTFRFLHPLYRFFFPYGRR